MPISTFRDINFTPYVQIQISYLAWTGRKRQSHVSSDDFDAKWLEESLSWTQFLSFQCFFFCIECKIDLNIELLSRIFNILKTKKTFIN